MNDVKDNANQKNISINDTIYKYFHIEKIIKLINPKIKTSKDGISITEFCAILTLALSIGLWGIRSIIYTFKLGVFSVYNINKSYLEINDSFIFQFIQIIAIAIIISVVNYIYATLITINAKKSSFSVPYRIIGFILFHFVETIILLVIIYIPSGLGIINLFVSLWHSPLKYKIILGILLFFLCCIINYIGTIVSFWHFKDKKNINLQKSQSNTTKNKNKKLIILIFILIMFSCSLIISYFLGISTEHQRTWFKVILQPVATNDYYAKKYYLKYESDDKCIIYPVIYENENIYIVSRLYKDENNEIKIEKEYQKTLDKNNVENIYIENIYNDISTE